MPARNSSTSACVGCGTPACRGVASVGDGVPRPTAITCENFWWIFTENSKPAGVSRTQRPAIAAVAGR